MTQPPTAATYPVAQLERRFTAFAVDRLLAWALLALVGTLTYLFVSNEVWDVVAVVAGAMVVIWLVLAVLAGVSGTSPGKMVAGLRVVHHGTGLPIGVGPALLRSLVLGVAGLPTFGIGVATLAWTAVEDRTRQRRGWHDHLTHTVVVDVRPAADEVPEDAAEAPRHIVNLTAMRLIPAPPVEAVKTPERSDHSMRRQQLPSDVTAPPEQRPSATPSHPQGPPPAQRPAPAPHQARHQVPPAPSGPRPAPSAGEPVRLPPPAPDAASRPAHPDRREAPPQPVPATRVTAGGPRWRVHFDNGESFVITGLALVGRRPEARPGEQVAHLVPLTSADMSVSKTHAQFGPAPDGAVVVMDRGSTNGTVLVRRGVSRQLTAGRPAALVDGDKVVFGDREMMITRES